MSAVFSFFLYSAAGWIYEVLLGFWYGYGFVNRGFLLGPYLPIYGFGGVLLLFALRPLMEKRLEWKGVSVTPVLVFLLIVAGTSAVEFLVSLGMEALFHRRWWDYSGNALNWNGRICFSASLRFGLGGMLFFYVFQPLFDRLFRRISKPGQALVTAGIIAVMLTDLIVTLGGYF